MRETLWFCFTVNFFVVSLRTNKDLLMIIINEKWMNEINVCYYLEILPTFPWDAILLKLKTTSGGIFA